MIQPGKVIEFNRRKPFKHLDKLGSGGTGDTHLFEEEITDTLFAIKKYSPKGANQTDENFQRFIDEIKILFKISHSNIVRVYNYYLYPESKVGYIQMEYIDGVSIDNYTPFLWEKSWEEVFTEVITAFEYLESVNILHRDIRPANILINKNDEVKIIDFGFGKSLNLEDSIDNSVFLNWPVKILPMELTSDRMYNHQTEIYFIGKLFNKLISAGDTEFSYQHILDGMIKINPDERYETFHEVSLEISKGILGGTSFTDEAKGKYQALADALSDTIDNHQDKYDPENDVNIVLNRLQNLLTKSSLETYIQDSRDLIKCFINNGYSYRNRLKIKVSLVRDFYEILQSLTPFKQKIVLDNLYNRFENIKVVVSMDDLPF